MCYDASGKRVSKRLTYEDPAENEVTTYYIYDGNNLVCEKADDGETVSCKYYLYNSQGVIGYIQDGVTYTYRKNLFGDITAIYQGATKVAEYAYDAWGNCTVTNLTSSMIGAYNPFRYRGYYWDKDLNLYYLMSRYYDPVTGRFVNADSLEYLDPETVGGLNLYSYCGNNPVMGVDPLGTSSSFWNYIKREFDEWWYTASRQLQELSQDIVDTIESFGENFVLDFGVGAGFGFSAYLSKDVSASFGAWVNAIHISISKELKHGVAIGTKGYVGASLTFFEIWELGGAHIDEFKLYGGEIIDNSKTCSSFFGISSSSYFGIGASYSIGFNLNDLLDDLRTIWQ